MPITYNRNTDMLEDNGVSSVLFGSGQEVLEVELNEIQALANLKLGKIIAAIVGNALIGSEVAREGDDLVIHNGYAFISGRVVQIDEIKTPIINDTNIYLRIIEREVKEDDILRPLGNLSSDVVADNHLVDNRYGIPLSHRLAYEYEMVSVPSSVILNESEDSDIVNTLHTNGMDDLSITSVPVLKVAEVDSSGEVKIVVRSGKSITDITGDLEGSDLDERLTQLLEDLIERLENILGTHTDNPTEMNTLFAYVIAIKTIVESTLSGPGSLEDVTNKVSTVIDKLGNSTDPSGTSSMFAWFKTIFNNVGANSEEANPNGASIMAKLKYVVDQFVNNWTPIRATKIDTISEVIGTRSDAAATVVNNLQSVISYVKGIFNMIKATITRCAEFTSNGTFIVPNGDVYKIKITAISAGGNGGRGLNAGDYYSGSGAGGGCGNHLIDAWTDVIPGQAIPITVGTGNTVIGTIVTLTKGVNGADYNNSGTDGPISAGGSSPTRPGTGQTNGSNGGRGSRGGMGASSPVEFVKAGADGLGGEGGFHSPYYAPHDGNSFGSGGGGGTFDPTLNDSSRLPEVGQGGRGYVRIEW